MILYKVTVKCSYKGCQKEVDLKASSQQHLDQQLEALEWTIDSTLANFDSHYCPEHSEEVEDGN